MAESQCQKGSVEATANSAACSLAASSMANKRRGISPRSAEARSVCRESPPGYQPAADCTRLPPVHHDRRFSPQVPADISPHLADSFLDLVGCDLVEVSPPYDTTGNTSLLAANLLFEMLCSFPGCKRR